MNHQQGDNVDYIILQRFASRLSRHGASDAECAFMCAYLAALFPVLSDEEREEGMAVADIWAGEAEGGVTYGD